MVFKDVFAVDDLIDEAGVPEDCSIARSKTWSPCTGWTISDGLWGSLAS